jgi:protein TonB
LRYPESAKRNGVEGKVYVMFVIDQDGSIDDKTVRALTPEEIGNFAVKTNVNLDAGCQEEAVRILRECPDWKPASIKKQPVRQRMVIPIPFNL